MDAEEFDNGGGATAPPDRLEAIKTLGQELLDQTELVEDIEADLKAAKKELHRLRTVALPEAMTEAQIDSIGIGNRTISLGDIVSGSLPKDPAKRKEAIDWLAAHDGAGLIKTTVTTAFAKSQREEALKVAKMVEAEGHPTNVKEDVHAQTLLSFVRGKLKDGSDIDPELLGVYVGKIAKVEE